MPITVAGPEIERLVQLLARLPGLGPRSARRVALHLIRRRETLLAPLADALRVVSSRAAEKKLALALDVGAEISFEADRRACKQVILNLLSNAVKFTPDGGHVDVHGRERGNWIVTAIEDTGIGIPYDALKRLGRPFEQVESQLTKSHQGSGLGLAIAKSLVELHGGFMRIRSRIGKGTMVIVRLPRSAPAADTRHAA